MYFKFVAAVALIRTVAIPPLPVIVAPLSGEQIFIVRFVELPHVEAELIVLVALNGPKLSHPFAVIRC